jgi:GT2 family glycosyltransferase
VGENSRKIPEGTAMKLSVLICTYNRPELLIRALETLTVNTEEKPDQIVVVNGGDARTDRLVESFITAYKDSVEIILVRTVNKNVASSRNVGLPHCRGDIIAMTDDDAEVFPNWVTLMKQSHRDHPEAGAVGGPVIGIHTDSLVEKAADLITFPDWPQPRYARTLPTVNISYKREVVASVGDMDETLFCGEDVDYNWRVQKLGYKIYFDPRIKVYHRHRATLNEFLNQHHMYGRAYYLVREKWQDMYCVYPHQIRGVKDGLKAINFVAALLYEPFKTSQQVSSLKTRSGLLPLLFLAELAWKSGMVEQARLNAKANA